MFSRPDANKGRRTFPSRNKFTPYLTVHCRRTERFEVLSETATVTVSEAPQGDPFCDLYYDNTIYLAHFNDTSASYLTIYSGGLTRFNNEVFKDMTTGTAAVMSIKHYGTDAASARSLRYLDTSRTKFGTSSLRLEYSNTAGQIVYSYITLDSNANHVHIAPDLDFTTSDKFTLEYWVYLDPNQPRTTTILAMYGGQWAEFNADRPCWSINLGSTSATASRNRLAMLFFNSANTYTSTGTTFPLTITANTWHHFALVKTTARAFSAYWDGQKVLQADSLTIPTTMNSPGDSNAQLTIGGGFADSSFMVHPFLGNIDELRYTSGVARYLSDSFSLMISEFDYTPCHNGFISFISTFDRDMQGDQVFFDGSGKTITFNGSGGADYSPAIYLSSAYFSGPDYLSVPSHSDFDLSSTDFTITLWIYPVDAAASSDTYASVVQIGELSATGNMQLQLERRNSWKLSLRGFNSSGYIDLVPQGSLSLSLNAWTNIAVEKENGVYRLYKNGTISTENTITYTHVQGALYIGGQPELTSCFYGNLEDVRLIKRGAHYKGNYIPTKRSLNYDLWE